MLSELFNVGDPLSSFGMLLSSMDNLMWLANRILFSAITGVIIIVGLLILLFLKDRKEEIGVYLALGEKKAIVIVQIFFEIMTPALVAISLSLVSGNLISHTLSTHMLEVSLLEQQEEMNRRYGDWGPVVGVDTVWLLSPEELSIEEMLAAYDTSLDVKTVATFFLIGVGTVLISIVGPLLYVTRLNPKKILM